MSDPVLISTKVVIYHLASDGYRAEWTAKAGKGTNHRVTGEKVPPQTALLSALEELARITALYGFQDEALELFNAARKRVLERPVSAGSTDSNVELTSLTPVAVEGGAA